MKSYLIISKAENLNSKKERLLYRFMEIVPGFLSWTTLIIVFFLSWTTPTIVAIFIILFDLYWLLKVGYLSFHQITSFREMKKNLRTNWLEKLNESNKDWGNIYHLVILPNNQAIC